MRRDFRTPPQLLRTDGPIARDGCADRRDGAVRNQEHAVGIQLADHAAGAAFARTSCCVLEDRETDAAGDRGRRCVRTHGGEDQTQFCGRIRNGAFL